VKDQSIVAIGVDETIFGASPEIGNACPGQALAKIRRKRSAKIGPARFDPRNAAAV
jgi:hypothetical protein